MAHFTVSVYVPHSSCRFLSILVKAAQAYTKVRTYRTWLVQPTVNLELVVLTAYKGEQKTPYC